MTFKAFVSEFLALVERQESRLLSWGFYGGSFDAGQVEEWLGEASADLQAAWTELAEAGESVDSLLERLTEERLLFELPERPGAFRTRFAEGVRLLASLRQLFPGRSWTVAPRLVSDVRIHLGPRNYPRRDIAAAECWNDLAPLVHPSRSELIRQCFLALAEAGNTALQFAGFQRRTFSHLFAAYGEERMSGSIVSAGTGSGKTKAFYIPALLRIVDDLAQRSTPFTKVIAIYPRTVLLSDQLREAVAEAEKLVPTLRAHGLRRITFGALLGDTPNAIDFDRVLTGTNRLLAEVRHWRRTGAGFCVPFLKAPSDSRRDLIWRDADRRANRTCLYADGSAGQAEIPVGVLRLTREELQAQPPDILFLSAEMLNRELGNTDWSRTFGVGQRNMVPRLILLDEVHTYQGVAGAQIAWLLRRWRHWARTRKTHFVGLSATLADGAAHLARVAGLPAGTVVEFRPTGPEMIAEGIEYNIAVKGNPAGASLLATSIQTAMLISRLLAPSHVPSAGTDEIHGTAFFGRKAFGFTDNLDTLNRWLGDMKDAEQKHLARLRQLPADGSPAQRQRLRTDGQVWEVCTAIGHNLNAALRVSGCSSQRPGLNANADLVIATSSLEVGFDDPEVGAVVHHKRPSSMASFVQRKGRAGRRRGMRPWTVVVLSDYGGDRFVFHNAEQLFSPEIPSLFLPVRNPYVLRQQATYFLLEWLGLRVQGGGPFSYLRPGKLSPQLREIVLRLLRDVLAQGPCWQRFRQELERFFFSVAGADMALPPAVVDAVLWNEPRPLLLEVIPTLIRKVESNWAHADPQRGGCEDLNLNRPLPAFIPAATFGELDLSEVVIAFPAVDKDEERMGIAQALYEFCPGRVSKRYSTADRESGYWLEASVRLLNDVTGMGIGEVFADAVLLDSVPVATGAVTVYQPLILRLVPQDPRVTERSNASWQWQSRIQPIGEGRPLPLSRSGVWQRAIARVQAHLHREQSGIEVLRFAEAWDFDLQLARPRGQTKSGRGTLGATDEQGISREAVGFRLKADGLEWEIASGFLAHLGPPLETSARGLRAHFYLDQLRTSPRLRGVVDRFSAEWIHRTSVAMLLATALIQHCSLPDAQAALRDIRLPALRKVLDQVIPVATDDDESPQPSAKLRDRLVGLWSNPVVLAEIENLERTLWEPLGEAFFEWCKRRGLSAIAQAFRAAALVGSEGVSEDDFTLDLFWDNTAPARVYLTEGGSGGLGHAEAVVAAMRNAPEQFPEAVRHALTFCPREQLATSMFAFLAALHAERPDGPLRTAVAAIRSAQDFKALEAASEAFKTALWQAGLDATRSFVVAVVARIVRPGSSAQTDQIAYVLNELWRRKCGRLGVEIDPAVFAYVCAAYKPVARRFARVLRMLSGGAEPAPGQVYRLVQQLLIEGCRHSCPECMADINHYNDAGLASRDLAAAWLGLRPPELRLDPARPWRAELRELVRGNAVAELVFGNDEAAEAMNELQVLLAEELEVDSLLVPVTVGAIRRRGRDWVVQVQIRGLAA
jgi:hypothetical protein